MASLQRIPLATTPAGESIWKRIERLRQSDETCLAPAFRAAVDRAVERAEDAGAPVRVFETCRSDELQAIYYAQGTSHARTTAYSWHGYGLAVDVIHPIYQWDWFEGRTEDARAWLRSLVRAFEAETFWRGGRQLPVLAWGGRWSPGKRDLPHWSWGRCRPTPSQLSIDAKARGGNAAVWRLVGAAA